MLLMPRMLPLADCFMLLRCSAKLIGCKYFLEGFSGNASAIKEAFPYEQISCRSVVSQCTRGGCMCASCF